MNSKVKYLFLFSVMSLLGCLDSETIINDSENERYTLSGTVVGAEDDTLILYKPNEDPYYQNIKIPVVDGKFNYEFEVNEPVGYDLMYWNNGQPGGRWMTVFLEKSDIDLTIYPQDEWDKNTVKGGNVNDDFMEFNETRKEKFTAEALANFFKFQELRDGGKFYSPAMISLTNAKEKAEEDDLRKIENQISELKKDNSHLSDSVRVLMKRSDQIYKEKHEWEKEYINSNNNIIAYYLFLTDLTFSPDKLNLEKGVENYKKFSAEFPDHPYNEVTGIKLESIATIKVGQRFKDFELPDLSGEEFSLSELIKGKIAVINLWATWCRSCIVKSIDLVPVYNDYSGEDFTVVGVAGEYKDTERLVRFLEKNEYPWKNLVELDAQNFIWEKYGVSLSGGGLFLVDEKGILVAINPSVEEIKNYLEKSIQ